MLRFTRIISLFVACALLIPGAALASQRDRNHDGLPDRWEKQHHLSLQVKQGGRDQDKDGLNNRGEFAAKTDPRDADSDDDGVGDGNEDADNDGVANDAETGNGASERSGSDAPRPGDRHEGETPPYNHVVAFSLAGDLELGRADGTSVTAAVGEHTSLLCAAALPGPFHPCAKTVLVTGAKVVNAKDEVNGSGVHLWSRVLNPYQTKDSRWRSAIEQYTRVSNNQARGVRTFFTES